MNPDLKKLKPYPFQRLAQLLKGLAPPVGMKPVDLSIGEPRQATPAFVVEALIANLDGLSRYPSTLGTIALRSAIADWLARRFELPLEALDPDRHVLPVNGTREALFSIAQAVVDRSRNASVLMPNPFYQIYEGAALLAGAEPIYLNCEAETGFLPDLDAVPAETWARCQLLYLCSPNNPTGAVLDEDYLRRALQLADRHGFVIAADECYSEIYFDESHPPPGLLGTAWRMGNTAFQHCLAFHSLSKRSNAPGLRSGFVAGDSNILAGFLSYRTYHGCAMSPPVQAASALAWSDEQHVIENRGLYREKFVAVLSILAPHLKIGRPQGGFCLWPEVRDGDERFTRALYERTHVTVLPGSYLARESGGVNPGRNRIRVALVASFADCVDAAERIAEFLRTDY